jgi:hypothetical protein
MVRVNAHFFEVVLMLEVVDDHVFVESLLAGLAWEIFIDVCVQMFFLIRNLIECEVTVFNWTLEGSLSCVNSQVVKKIMPLFENFFALKIVLLAEKGALDPLASDIFKLDLCKILG